MKAALLVPVVALGATLLLRWVLDPWLADREALSLLYGAVGLSVWIGGWRPAAAVVVVGLVASDWLFIAPRADFGFDTVPNLVAGALYLLSCAIIITFGEAMRRARNQLLASKQAVERQAEELQRLNRELQEADGRKDDFIATLAHELRSPLAPIRNATQVWRAGNVPPEKREWACGVVERQVNQMARLLEELLDVSRIKQGKIEIRKSCVTLADVIASAVETSRPHIDASRHQLIVDLPERPILLDADGVRLAQVFSNLLNNAAKYTDPGGRIELHATTRDGFIEVRVEDNGIGFPPEIGEQLFAPFRQAESATGRAGGGLGIGLSLVRALVTLHGGTVHARSEGPQLGSQFVVRLPCGGAATRPP